MNLKVQPSCLLLTISISGYLIATSFFMMAFAQQKCKGESCDGKIPITYQCEKDATTLVHKDGESVTRPGHLKQKIKVELRYSKNCHAKWVKARVLRDSIILLKNKQGIKVVNKTIDKDGEYTSEMKNGDIQLQACFMLGQNQPQVCTELR